MKRQKLLAVLPLLFAGIVGLAASPVFAQTHKEEARVAKNVWSGYWWPTYRAEILGPLGKYDKLTGANSVQWQKTNYPPKVNGRPVPKWHGLCHAWAASSVLEDEPTRSVSAGNARLSIGDQKGWLAVCHANDVANFYGRRYNGGGDDPNDLSPEDLWSALRRHIKEQRIPIVLDIEPLEQVWNYPVYAYRVEYSPKSAGSDWHAGKICVWMADDGVPKDFVGTRRLYQEYTFEAQFAGGSIIVGTGRWTGKSVKVHPDFAWFPYVVRPENPEVDYATVCKLTGRNPITSVQPPTTPDTTPDTTPETDPETTPDTTPDATPETDSDTIPEDGSVSLTVESLLALVDGTTTSDFQFNVNLPNHTDGQFVAGEEITLSGKSQEDGYLYLFAVNPNGDVSVLYPQPNDDNRVRANEPFAIPSNDAKYLWRASEPIGIHRIKAVVTEKPLVFTGSSFDAPDDSAQLGDFADADKIALKLGELALRLSPSENEAIQELKKSKGGVPFDDELKAKIGRYAQTEATLYIGKAPETKPEVPEKK